MKRICLILFFKETAISGLPNSFWSLKILRRRFALSLLIVFFSTNIFSQQTPCIGGGVYLTYEDFTSNKISYPIDFNQLGTGRWGVDISVSAFDKLKVRSLDSTYKPGNIFGYYKITKFKAGQVYGYFKKGIQYRSYKTKGLFSPKGYFRILASDSLTLYTQYHSGHHSSHYHYYYSTGPNAPIKYLREKTLASDFPSYPEFISAIGLLNKGWKGSLLLKDEEGQYKILSLYGLLVKNKKQ